MKIADVALPDKAIVTGPAPIGPPVSAGVQDMTVTVEHDDGTQVAYTVRSKAELMRQVQAYVQWQSDLAELQAMSGKDFDL